MLPFLLSYLFTFLSAYPFILDGLKFAIIGMFLEGCRRSAQVFWVSIQQSLTVTMHIPSTDETYSWLRSYLSKLSMEQINLLSDPTFKKDDSIISILLEGFWPKGRIAPRNIVARSKSGQYKIGYGDAGEDDDDDEIDGSMDFDGDGNKIKTTFFPAMKTQHTVRHKGYTIKFSTYQTSDGRHEQQDWLEISAWRAPLSLLVDLIQTARDHHRNVNSGRLVIWNPHSHFREQWERTATKPSRPWESVILPKDIKDGLLADAKEFMEESAFYRSRGLPYRRGYLLHGQPGAGKSSLIAALASKLVLDVYIVNLSSRSLDDSGLQRLLHLCPSRCILLMEDIDCAFNDREAQESEIGDEEIFTKMTGGSRRRSGVTLSGLLNALDGVASSEGRLLFCTTNHVDKIDAALSRPGRCDVWIEFTNATKSQIRDHFLHFFRPAQTSLSSQSTVSSPYPPSTPILHSTILEKISYVEGPTINTSDTNIPSGVSTPSTTDTLVLSPLFELEDEDDRLVRLAEMFENAIPDQQVSVSALQAYLMRYKRQPEAAVINAKEWVAQGYPQSAKGQLSMSIGQKIKDRT